MSTDIVDGVRKLGFRRWYQRCLVEAHAYLVTGFLFLILALAMFEASGGESGAARLGWLVGAAASMIGSMALWLRYHRVLAATELAAELATCPHCGTYGRLQVIGYAPASPREIESDPRRTELPHLTARCRSCGGEWRMEPPRV